MPKERLDSTSDGTRTRRELRLPGWTGESSKCYKKVTCGYVYLSSVAFDYTICKIVMIRFSGEFDSKSFPDMNFTLEYVLQEDGKWGSYWERENKTTGLVHTIVSGRADITGKNYSS